MASYLETPGGADMTLSIWGLDLLVQLALDTSLSGGGVVLQSGTAASAGHLLEEVGQFYSRVQLVNNTTSFVQKRDIQAAPCNSPTLSALHCIELPMTLVSNDCNKYPISPSSRKLSPHCITL